MTKPCKYCAQGHKPEDGEHWIATGLAKVTVKKCTAPPPQLYNVDVWDNFRGDIVKSFIGVTADEVDDIRERYEDEPLDVVVEEAR